MDNRKNLNQKVRNAITQPQFVRNGNTEATLAATRYFDTEHPKPEGQILVRLVVGNVTMGVFDPANCDLPIDAEMNPGNALWREGWQ